MRVLVVDDHQLIRSALADLLRNKFIDVECVEADCSQSALAALQTDQFDCAIVDLFLPGETVFVFLRNLCSRWPQLPVVILSASENTSQIRKCFDLGASGFVNKGEAMEKVCEAVKTVLAGGQYVPDILSQQSSYGKSYEDGSLPDLQLNEVINKLTDRQLDVLRLVAEGKSNKEIARERGLSDNTIKVHVSAILRALGLNNRTQMGLLAQKIDILNG